MNEVFLGGDEEDLSEHLHSAADAALSMDSTVFSAFFVLSVL